MKNEHTSMLVFVFMLILYCNKKKNRGAITAMLSSTPVKEVNLPPILIFNVYLSFKP